MAAAAAARELAGILALGEWQSRVVAGLQDDERAVRWAPIADWASAAMSGASRDLQRGRAQMIKGNLPKGWDRFLREEQVRRFRNQSVVDTALEWLRLEPEVTACWPVIAVLLVGACREYTAGRRASWFLNCAGLWHILVGAQRGTGSADAGFGDELEPTETWPEWVRDMNAGEWDYTCPAEISPRGVELAELVAVEMPHLRTLATTSMRTSESSGRKMRREIRERAAGLCEQIVGGWRGAGHELGGAVAGRERAGPGRHFAPATAWPYPHIRERIIGNGDLERWSYDFHPMEALALETYDALKKMSGVRSRTDLVNRAFTAEQCASATLAMVRARAGVAHE